MSSINGPSSTTPLLGEQSSRIRSTDEQTVGVAASHDTVDIKNDGSMAKGSLEQWNDPSINMWRVSTTFFSFMVVGAIDGAYGVLIHYLGKYYNADYLAISFILLSPVLGYAIAAVVNNTIHVYFGQRGIAIIGPGLHVIAFLSATQHPPFLVLVFICFLAGLGSGLIDAGWNAWLGAKPNSSGIMGSLHGFYGLGAALAPLVATSVITKCGWQWYEFYYLMASAAMIELCTSAAAFWANSGSKYRTIDPAILEPDTFAAGDHSERPQADKQQKSPTIQALMNISTWLMSLFIFVYAGIEISLADWIMTLLVDVRHQSPFAGSMVTFGYWGGLTLGRIILGFLIPCFKTEKGAVTACLVMSIIMHLLFSLKTDLVTSAIATPLLGFFLGPLFPEAVVMQTKLVPKRLHVASVGVAVALGSAGGCVFPFLIGAIAKTEGIQILQPSVLVMLAFCLAVWLALPSPSVDVADEQASS